MFNRFGRPRLGLCRLRPDRAVGPAVTADRARPGDPPAAWYRVTVDRKGEQPARHLAGTKGWMRADGYSGFNDLYRRHGIHEVAGRAVEPDLSEI